MGIANAKIFTLGLKSFPSALCFGYSPAKYNENRIVHKNRKLSSGNHFS
jgi:hypothetical protein